MPRKGHTKHCSSLEGHGSLSVQRGLGSRRTGTGFVPWGHGDPLPLLIASPATSNGVHHCLVSQDMFAQSCQAGNHQLAPVFIRAGSLRKGNWFVQTYIFAHIWLRQNYLTRDMD